MASSSHLTSRVSVAEVLEPVVQKSSTPVDARLFARATIAFWCAAILLGLLELWVSRHTMNTDGIAYLDIASGFARGDWSAGVNGYWNPLYPMLLSIGLTLFHPSPYWEFTVVHLVNFFIFLAAASAFQFFLTGFLRYHQRVHAKDPERWVPVPRWGCLLLGYALFLWTSLRLIAMEPSSQFGIAVVSPDLCVAGFVYLATGILLRLKTGQAGTVQFGLLAAVLAVAYLAKAPMLPLAAVFLATAVFAGNPRLALQRLALGLAVFLAIAAPFITALSRSKGRLTAGDSAKLNYVWYVNHVPRYHWQGEVPGAGTPRHPTKKLFATPAVYEFDIRESATYAAWYDPSYWYDGIRPLVGPKSILKQMLTNSLIFYDIFFHQQATLIVVCLLLFLMGGRGQLLLADLAEQWVLLLPVLGAFGMYMLVHVEPRFVTAFVVLLWMALFSAIRVPAPQAERAAGASVIAVALFTIVTTGASALGARGGFPQDLFSWRSPHEQYTIAQDLQRAGIQPGDKIAWIRPAFFNTRQNYSWARLAKVQIIAEVPADEEPKFWATSPAERSQLFRVLAGTGARALIATQMPPGISRSGWQPIGKTGYYAHFLDE